MACLGPSDGELTIHVVALAPSLNPTQGWSTVPANVLPEVARDHEVTALVSERTDSQFESRYDFEIRSVLPDPMSMLHPARVLQHVPAVRDEIAGADVVHSFIAYPYLPAAAVATLGRGTPITATALGTYAVRPLGSFWTRQLLAFGYRRSRTVFCISDYTERRITDAVGTSNTAVLPLGIDLDRFGSDSTTDGRYILSVGSIKARKGQDVLLRAFSRIVDEYPSIDLKIVGPVHSADYRATLDEILSDSGIERRVEFLGSVEDRDRLGALYRDCTFFALTPRVVDDNFEGFGLVYLEAAAYGKPSVATDSGGVPTAVKDGETGLLAPEDDVDGVADALRSMLQEESRAALGRNARSHAEALTWERYAERLETEWNACL